MNVVSEFVVGENYTNDQIRFSLAVGNLGGVRPAINPDGSLRHIAIMTSTEEGRQGEYSNPYQDRIEGDILTFTGTGRKGDQTLSGANKRITEQLDTPVAILGFINHGKQSYEFLGLLGLVRYYSEQQIDQARKLRAVWIFEFRIHKSPTTVPIALAKDLAESIFVGRTSPLAQTELEVMTNLAVQASSKELLKAEDIRARLLQIDPYKFEHLIKAVAERTGFTKVEVTRSSGDSGVDINAVVSESNDFFAGTFVQIQAKRWRHAVGSSEVNSFRGAMSSMAKGIFITTSYYTRAAIENAYHTQKSCVTLIDGNRFSGIVLRSGVHIKEFEE